MYYCVVLVHPMSMLAQRLKRTELYYLFQLLCVIHTDPNTYGSLCAFIIGLTLRLGGGEPAFNLDPFIYYPGGKNFPYKTFSMIISLITILVVSYGVKYLFVQKILPEKYDIFDCNLAHGGRTIDQYLDGDDVEPSRPTTAKLARSTSSAAELRARYHKEGGDFASGQQTTSFHADAVPPPYDEGVSNVGFEGDGADMGKSEL